MNKFFQKSLGTATDMEVADCLRIAADMKSPKRLPIVGDIIEVLATDISDESEPDPKLGICTGYIKGWCCVRGLDERGELTVWLDFISDEDRHGPSKAIWKIRDDLRQVETPTEVQFEDSAFEERGPEDSEAYGDFC